MCLGIPGRLVEITEPGSHFGVVELTGVRRVINIGLLVGDEGGVAVGDWVLIHVGFAMAKIDEEEAQRALAFLAELGDVYDEEFAQFRDSG